MTHSCLILTMMVADDTQLPVILTMMVADDTAVIFGTIMLVGDADMTQPSVVL